MLKTLTSSTIEDERDQDGTYAMDCYNTDYCKVKRRKYFDFLCLAGARSQRCSIDKKLEIEQEAMKSSFKK